MNPKKLPIILSFILIVMILGCEENNTITNELYYNTSSSVVGRIISDSDTVNVYLWQEALKATTQTDKEGYFEFFDIEPGVYELRAAVGTSELKKSNIEVKKNETTSLGEIKLNYLPWPFTTITPSENEQNVTLTSYSVSVSTDVALDHNSMNSSIVFNPPFPGHWHNSESPYFYIYHSSEPGIIDTNYTITILPSLRMSDGSLWNDSLTISFRTAGFQTSSKLYGYPLTSVPPSMSRDFLTYRYNSPLDRTSAENSVSITPPVNFLVNVINTYDTEYLSVNFLEVLTPSQTYTLVIAPTLKSTSGLTTGITDSVVFTVEPLLVKNYGFTYSNYDLYRKNIAPGLYFDFNILLNADVNMNTFNAATTIIPNIAGIWFSIGEGRLAFAPSTSQIVIPEQEYTVTINGNASLIGGVGFGNDVVLKTYVDPVSVTSMSPQNGSNSVSTNPTMSFSFNTEMNQSITQNAISLQTIDGTPVNGSFYWYTYGDGMRVSFNPSLSLESGKYYQLQINTTAESIDGYKLKTATKSIFKTRY